jgi:hypothetical protein
LRSPLGKRDLLLTTALGVLSDMPGSGQGQMLVDLQRDACGERGEEGK